MKRILASVLLAVICLVCSAQTYVISGDLLSRKVFQVKAHVVDSVSNENLSFVSAYLRFKSDTLITNFALSDIDGNVELNDVTVGDYILTVEYLGYEKYQKNFYVRKDSDMGEIRLKPDIKALEAASITAAGNEVEIKKDTIIFNATLFKVGSNDNLAALLKRMPGIEISESGSVKVNGKVVDKITVEGKTFFMNDKNTALNSLPASIVDKIKVIDGESDEAKISGVKDIQKERVMDVELKQEYKTGFFGNASLAAGTTVPGAREDEFLESGKVVHNSSLMASLYNERDQLTVVGNAGNVAGGSESAVVVFSAVGGGGGGFDAPSVTLPSAGVHTTWNMGANLNTDRLKNVSSSVSARYTEDYVDYHKRSDRTTFQGMTEDLRDMTDLQTDGTSRNLSLGAEFSRLNGTRSSFSFRPSIKYSRVSSNSGSEATSSIGEALQNSSSSLNGAFCQTLSTSGNLTASINGKNNSRRRLVGGLGYGFSKGDGDGFDKRYVSFKDGTGEIQSVTYDTDNDYYSLNPSLMYVEPLTESWLLQLTAASNISSNKSIKDARNEDNTVNELFSSRTANSHVSNSLRAMGQYHKDMTTVDVGASANLTETVVESTAAGITTVNGKDDWMFNINPYMTLMTYSKDYSNQYVILVEGSTSSPVTSDVNPAMRITSPTRLSVGNIYLRPYYSQTFMSSLYMELKKNTSLNIFVNGTANENAISSAIWYDGRSMMYSIPVNVRKPSLTMTSNLSLTGNITENGTWRYYITLIGDLNSRTSYQSTGLRPGLDTDSFTYDEFMRTFWGNAAGDIFYSGQSGFKESRTTSGTYGCYGSIRYKTDRLQMNARIDFDKSASRYSLDPRANLDTRNISYGLDATYFTKHDFEIQSKMDYYTYKGYRGTFNDPLCRWDASLVKNVKAFTLGISVRDILNQARTRSTSWTDNYSEYSYTNTIGRCFLFSVKFNFGKMNAAKSSAAQSASLRMML